MLVNILNKKILPILFLVLGIVILSSLLFYRYKQITNQSEQKLQEQVQDLPKKEQEQQTNVLTNTKIYRNEEYDFEFQYPEDWEFTENSFGGPFSKFNLILEKDLKNYNPFSPSFLINIVTPDFADRAIINRENLGVNVSDFTLQGIQGKKYEYVFDGLSKISIDIPFGEYRMLLSTNKSYKEVFNQILSSFKFLK